MRSKVVLLAAKILFLLSWLPGLAIADPKAVAEAEAVMHEFIRTFNSRDEAAWAETLLFPHVRVASGGVTVTPTKAQFVAETDLDEFALSNNWGFSEWDSIELIQSGPDKVHFKVKFSRFNPQGERYVSFDSLYVLQKVDGKWGIRLRSSFAP
ncbi:MAG: hypothetical protein AAF541_00410 [Pseudomonadota bacterium]